MMDTEWPCTAFECVGDERVQILIVAVCPNWKMMPSQLQIVLMGIG